MEGIIFDGEGGFWIVFEGCIDCMVLYGFYYVNVDGEIEDEIVLLVELLVVEKWFGFEGIIMVGDILWMVVQ